MTEPLMVKFQFGTTRLHWLKSWPVHFAAVANGNKKAELRVNDRDFRIGDVIGLEEWDQGRADYTGRQFFGRITHIGEKYAGILDHEYVLLSFEPTAEPTK